jgi:hypothetical protein
LEDSLRSRTDLPIAFGQNPKKGHEERFPLPRLSDRYGFSKETVARVPGSDRDAPLPAVRRTTGPVDQRSFIEAPLSVPIVNLWWPVSITVLSARKVGPDEVRK